MLRFETKKVGDVDQTTFVGINNDMTNKIPIYSHRIKEPLAFMPNNHYLTLVSAYTPLKPFEMLGSISFKIKNTKFDVWDIKSQISSDKICCLADVINHMKCSNMDIEIEDGKIKFITTFDLSATLPTSNNTDFQLQLSNSAARMLGFSKTLYCGKLGDVITSNYAYPPVFVQYIQILCHNVCGTKDSNMTFPETMAIYPLTNTVPIFDPHIATSHRIEKGKVLDIEILDQNNRPFTHAPVYLEFYITEGSDHEKKQGFFRIGKTTKLILTEPVTKISLPYMYAFSRLETIPKREDKIVLILTKTDTKNEKSQIALVDAVGGKAGTIPTRRSILKDVLNWSAKSQATFQDKTLFIKGHFEQNVLVIFTNIYQVTIKKCYLNYMLKGEEGNHRNIIIKGNIENRIELGPECLYTQNQRLFIYCMEHSSVNPIAVAARNVFTFNIINPHFWYWCNLEKPTNVLTFFYKLVNVYEDGMTIEQDSMSIHSELILNLFYK